MFELVSEYKAAGDQPQAIRELVHGLHEGRRYQTLLGVTGSGQDIHACKCACQGEPSGSGAFAQQNAGGAALQ